MSAPIAFFAYNRPEHTRMALEQLSRANGANQATLYIFCDGPKAGALPEEQEKIEQVRKVARSQKWCREVIIREADNNLGLTRSIAEGITEVVNKHGTIIVVEDDILIGKHFLDYCNAALIQYANNEEVMHVGGFLYPSSKKFNAPFFTHHVLVWGWATWKRAWNHFSLDTGTFISQLNSPEIVSNFNIKNKNGYYDFLMRQHNKEINTWDICWYASVFFNNGISLYPSSSIIQNIGIDSSGTHWTGNHSVTLPQAADYNPIPNNWPTPTVIDINEDTVNNDLEAWLKPSLVQRVIDKIKSLV